MVVCLAASVVWCFCVWWSVVVASGCCGGLLCSCLVCSCCCCVFCCVGGFVGVRFVLRPIVVAAVLLLLVVAAIVVCPCSCYRVDCCRCYCWLSLLLLFIQSFSSCCNRCVARAPFFPPLLRQRLPGRASSRRIVLRLRLALSLIVVCMCVCVGLCVCACVRRAETPSSP